MHAWRIVLSLPLLSLLGSCSLFQSGESSHFIELIDDGKFEEVRLGLPSLQAREPAEADEVVDYGLRQVVMPPDGDEADLERSRELLEAITVRGSRLETTCRYAQGLCELKSGNYVQAKALLRNVTERDDATDSQLAVCYFRLALFDLDAEGRPNRGDWEEFLKYEDAVGDLIDPGHIAHVRAVMDEQAAMAAISGEGPAEGTGK